MDNLSMPKFLRSAGEVNSTFSFKNRFVASSLDPLIRALGGRTLKPPPDRRVFNTEQKLAIAKKVWPVGAPEKPAVVGTV